MIIIVWDFPEKDSAAPDPLEILTRLNLLNAILNSQMVELVPRACG